MAIYQCWFQGDVEKDGYQIISGETLEDVAEEFAMWAWYERDMQKYLTDNGEDYWNNDYAIKIRRQGSNKIRIYNVGVSMTPDFNAELVK